MVLDKQETGTGSCTRWHKCPLCGKVRLTSQPESMLEGTEQADAYSHESVDTHQRSETTPTNFNYT